MNGTLLKVLLSLMATAYLAWAAVVWHTGQEAVRLTELNQERVQSLAERVRELRDILARHSQEPTHRQSNAAISRLTQQMTDVERRLESLEKFRSPASSN